LEKLWKPKEILKLAKNVNIRHRHDIGASCLIGTELQNIFLMYTKDTWSFKNLYNHSLQKDNNEIKYIFSILIKSYKYGSIINLLT